MVRATGYGVPPLLFGFVALVGVANGALLTMIMASRMAYGVAEEGLLPAVLSRVLPKRRTPWVAIIATTIAAMLLAVTGTLVVLAETVVLLLLFVFISTNLAVLVLRRDRVAHAHFRAPTFCPVLAVLSCLVLMTQQSAGNWLRAGLLLGAACCCSTCQAHDRVAAALPESAPELASRACCHLRRNDPHAVHRPSREVGRHKAGLELTLWPGGQRG